MRSEVLKATKMSMLVFWVVTACELVGKYQRFGGKYYLHPQGWPCITIYRMVYKAALYVISYYISYFYGKDYVMTCS
jgi:hypothetical protein